MAVFKVDIQSTWHWALIMLTSMTVITRIACEGNADISNHIRQCCLGGLRHARLRDGCANYEYEVSVSIPPLWRGLCYSTYGVCCSREINQKHCEAGQSAALTGSRCEATTQQYNTTTAYTDCCLACQVGLAVKASEDNCNDEMFSYFVKIDSYRICCGDDNSVSHVKQQNEPQQETDGDGIIVLPEDDDDICSKVPNLCEHICENTNEAYRCKCRPGYKLDDNNVTCTPVVVQSDAVVKTEHQQQGGAAVDDEYDVSEMDDDDGVEENKNTAGSSQDYLANCSKGYELRHNKCIDIDECTAQLDNCKINQYCLNTDGSYRCLSIKSDKCEVGFRFNITSETCEEYNECDDLPCEDGYKCINYEGRYKCEKVEMIVANPNHSKVSSSSTGYSKIGQQNEMKCGSGFHFKHGLCMDINECLADESACDSSQVCTNDIGGYHCDCKIGFNLDTTTNACVDINECSINNHNCLSSQRCDNTVGSYICTRLQSCGTGYTLNAESGICDDDDECALNLHNCTPDYECYNTKGSFRCHRRPPSTTSTTTTTTKRPTTTTTTPATPIPTNSKSSGYGGYSHYFNRTQQHVYPAYASHQTHSRNHQLLDYAPRYIGSGGNVHPCDIGFNRNQLGACVDTNECISNNPCSSHQRCINTNGSYRCQNLLQCAAGYKSTPDGTSCVDIDECAGEHNCAGNQICQNRNGGYICTCPPGHHLIRHSSGVQRCVDINECEQERPPVCPSNAQCLNTIGSYYCECKSGYQKSLDNERICLDVDECQTIPGLCQQKCVNFWGGYRCTCNPGYELSADNRTCNDVDECEVHKSYKLCMGFCNNVPGSYECSCPRGYTIAMDKNTCRDIDECASGDFCTGRHDICTNTRGSYKCTTIHCPYGYVNDPDQKNRCRQTSNLCDGDDCYNKPSAYTYNFITLVSKLMIPPEGRIIFSLRGPLWYDDIDFDFKIVKIQVAANIEKATEHHFDTIKGKHEVHLSLKRSLEGPQDIELDLSMTVFTNGMPRGKSVAKIFIVVSQYTF